MRTVAVVPTHREENLIGDTVSSLMGLGEVDRVQVVDDDSRDGTAMVAIQAGARVVVQGRNLGKGKSLNRVLPYLDFDVLLLIDGDLGKHASQAGLLLEPVVSGEADLSIAAFPPPTRKGGFGFVQGLARRGIEEMAGRNMMSPISGQRAMTREVYAKISPFDAGFGVEVGMTIDALRAGFRVVEVRTDMSHRETGRDLSGFAHRGKQFLDIRRALFKRRAEAGRRGC